MKRLKITIDPQTYTMVFQTALLMTAVSSLNTSIGASGLFTLLTSVINNIGNHKHEDNGVRSPIVPIAFLVGVITIIYSLTVSYLCCGVMEVLTKIVGYIIVSAITLLIYLLLYPEEDRREEGEREEKVEEEASDGNLGDEDAEVVDTNAGDNVLDTV